MGVYSYVKWKNAILVKFNESFSFVLTQKKQWYESVIQKVENLIQSIENHYSATTLPDFPDLDKTTKILIQIREKLYHHE
ncbi:hypothetical protein [Chryseobacterium gleum]|jgi:hypothetical protein|uniref:hypothetical protein n=1 Tax=Chryseobacterium gleum TaxID=250 RepID=UPI00241EFF4A|nr:hypothetical protein [Chryseobacterium gleum]